MSEYKYLLVGRTGGYYHVRGKSNDENRFKGCASKYKHPHGKGAPLIKSVYKLVEEPKEE